MTTQKDLEHKIFERLVAANAAISDKMQRERAISIFSRSFRPNALRCNMCTEQETGQSARERVPYHTQLCRDCSHTGRPPVPFTEVWSQ